MIQFAFASSAASTSAGRRPRWHEHLPLPATTYDNPIPAPDAGRAIALIMTTSTLQHDTYNVSSGRPAANREFTAALEAAVPGAQVLPDRADGGSARGYLCRW